MDFPRNVIIFITFFPLSQSYRILPQKSILSSPNAGFSSPNADSPPEEEEHLHKTYPPFHKNRLDRFVLPQDL